MGRERVKVFLKANMSAGAWLAMYVVVQTVVMIAAMMYLIFHNETFASQFVLIFEPIVGMGNYFEKQIRTMEGLLVLMSDKMSMMLLFSSIITIGITVIWLFVSKRKIPLNMNPIEVGRYIRIGLVLNLIITILVGIIPQKYKVSHEYMETLAVSGGIWLDIIATGILVPITEELIFRMGILQALRRFNVHYAIVYQAVVFGVLHGNLVQGCYALLLGLYFGYLTVKKDNIMYALVLHITINLSSVIIGYASFGEIIGLLYLCLITCFLFFGYRFILCDCFFLKKRIK